MTTQDVTRNQQDARALKAARDSLNRSIGQVREALSRFIHNSHVVKLMTRAAEAEAKMAQGYNGHPLTSEAWDLTDPQAPRHVFTYTTSTQATDANGDPVTADGDAIADSEGRAPEDPAWVPTYQQVPVYETVDAALTYDPAQRFVVKDDSLAGDPTVWFYPSGDAPSVGEFVQLQHGLASLAAVIQDVTPEEMLAMFGRAALAPEDIFAALDAWQ
jgi:hypothetical protein